MSMKTVFLLLAQGLAVQAVEPRLERLQTVETLLLAAPLHHVQGIDIDGDRLYVTSVDRQTRKGYLHLLRLPGGEVLKEIEVQEGPKFHPGGISLDETSVWLPVAEYRRDGASLIQRRDKNSLALLSSFAVSDHIGCVAAGRDAIFGGNWDSRQIYRWDLKGRQLEKKDNPSRTAYQDMKIVGGDLVASGLIGPDEGAVEWLDPFSLQLRRLIKGGRTDRGVRYNNEGMALRQGRLYLLPEDGPSRLFVFSLPTP